MEGSDNLKLVELKSILLKSASNAMKIEGENALSKGMITYFKSKNIDNIYHIYGKVRDENKPKEYDTHIKINLQKKRLDGVVCSCDEFKEFASSGYTFMCSHLTATSYKFLSLILKDKKVESQNKKEIEVKEVKKSEKVSTARLTRIVEKDSIYYQGQKSSSSERIKLKPNELRAFLEGIENKKIKFKYDYIEFLVPIFHKDLPITFNLKEDNNHIILTTHKQLPISLNSNNDVYYFKNEIYLPSKNQIENYPIIHEKLKLYGKVTYKKDINNYNKLISILSRITKEMNISEGLRNFATNVAIPEFNVYLENNKIYCDVFLIYGNKKINILNESKNEDAFIRDYNKEDKLLMKIEKNSFIKHSNRFMFIGGDEELFNILKRKENSLHSLGKVILGEGLKKMKLYNSTSIISDLYETDGYYDFSYRIGDIGKDELYDVFEAYKGNLKFYKTKSNEFLDFEDEGIKHFFNLFGILDISENIGDGNVKIEKSKALYLYENIKSNVLGNIKESIELNKIGNKLTNFNKLDIKVPDSFIGSLREYQVKGFKWLKMLSEIGFGGILADEMGLGKTVQTIAFMLSERGKSTLIICPTSLLYNWKDELDKFAPSLKVLILHGAERLERIEGINEYDVILTTYGVLKRDIGYYKDITFDYCVIDEGQNIKNSLTQNTVAIKKINAKTKFALTGTPIENNLTELWSIFDFILPGYLYAKETFEKRFVQSGDENLEWLKLLIKPFILRRTKKEVVSELPDKIEKKFLVEMTAPQKSIYGNYIKTIKSKIKNGSDDRFHILSYLTKLRQICLDPSLVSEDYCGGSGKLDIAMKLVKEHSALGGKVLLFSQFTSALDKIQEKLSKEKIEYFRLDGKTKPKDRIKMVQDFNKNEDKNVFLISLKAGGTGLNLTAANLVIHLDPWWNPAVQDQATDRAHRIGQTHTVEVIKLVARGTIEEKIIHLQEDKKELINSILTGELKNSSLIETLSREDLINLFDRDYL